MSDYPVNYWTDVQIGTSGLKTLGMTSFMNAPVQCLSATVPFSRFFLGGHWKRDVNLINPVGSKGKLTGAFAKLLHDMWGGDLPYLTPTDFRKIICQLGPQFNGSHQHDSVEFLAFLMDGIHEDLNPILKKPNYIHSLEEEAELQLQPLRIQRDREWSNWRVRNDSLIVDLFMGQFRTQLECLTCHKMSTAYSVFSLLKLPIPHASGKIPIECCLDEVCNEEILEEDDAWVCSHCNKKRQAVKKTWFAHLPPILIIPLKRFKTNGRFVDKIDTSVEFPMKNLDLTNYMPPPLALGADRSPLDDGLPVSLEDPRTQVPPYRYDLYGVTNHYGNFSSGHCEPFSLFNLGWRPTDPTLDTAFVASSGGWVCCDDSIVTPLTPEEVVVCQSSS
ncbi:hypothetical protein GALMADRAFT_74739 [Galerina marginata CBS 339.88]|uniref:ubiquitinyl hydrolase 1 n=1 Tax=Galerina marginata (strain CBS 339.88) TaxID=685588 RepID=A0A067SYH2_GALM3|nr:hypothetical protein GALMADRAFT_74739 [Galerina marginata CBS 339.88]